MGARGAVCICTYKYVYDACHSNGNSDGVYFAFFRAVMRTFYIIAGPGDLITKLEATFSE